MMRDHLKSVYSTCIYMLISIIFCAFSEWYILTPGTHCIQISAVPHKQGLKVMSIPCCSSLAVGAQCYGISECRDSTELVMVDDTNMNVRE